MMSIGREELYDSFTKTVLLFVLFSSCEAFCCHTDNLQPYCVNTDPGTKLEVMERQVCPQDRHIEQTTPRDNPVCRCLEVASEKIHSEQPRCYNTPCAF